MNGDVNRNGIVVRRRLGIAALLLTVFVVGVLWVRSRADLTPMERQLVGRWIMEQSPGVTRVMTLASDRRVTIRDSATGSGAILGEVLGDKDEIWFVDGQTLFIRRGRKGLPSLRDRISHNVFVWDQWPIASLSDDVLVIGNEAWARRFVLKRAATSPNRPE
jgi:hypothetical protein